jgi:WD40 repeat protein
MIGVVWNKGLHGEGKPSQRYFFGHNNDITCMAIHPSRRFVATGQQTHKHGTPYLCIWDVDTMCQVQRLVHPDDTRR